MLKFVLAPSSSLVIVTISDLLEEAFTLNTTLDTMCEYKLESLAIVNVEPLNVSPLLPLVTLLHEVPPFILYCQFE